MRKQAGILTLISFLLAFSVYGQQDSTLTKIAGISFGTSIPKTDLEPAYKKPGTQMSASLQFIPNRWFNVGFWVSVGEVQAENRDVRFFDQGEFQINDFAKTNYQSLHVEPSIHLLKKPNYSIYLSQGFGFLRFSVFDRDNNDLASKLNSRDQGEDYSNFTVLLPTTLNAYYFLANDFGFQLRTGWLNPQTDYLDNISNFGNPENNDNLFILQFSLIKRFNFKTLEDEK
ncbi:hypothetical protein [Marivirga harenae]|uniref:hypothetical protein n=1 Tax=Marivirga harenae TaxID=2010992 RepID=UPI0026E008CC|nr:hypothetical protein [Marivirga harenae]WKV10673.1 hypothetical protein Q3Y49_10660 [Marivirga harenae]|tara:strand:+ start:56620 stop:57306 length:687 start_codon:yes stop_codon:yes gene_type:complete